MSSDDDHSKDEELDTLQDIDDATFQQELSHNPAKVKALQQLAVSVDSPFSKDPESTNIELRRLKEEKTAILQKETQEIRKQLDLVRSRLQELKIHESGKKQVDSLPREQKVTKKPSTRMHNKADKTKEEPKLRPLTGSADCPNCICDRKSSVCDLCMNFGTFSPRKDSNFLKFDAPERTTDRYDDRPIRPARDRKLATVEVVDEVVVPNKLYTISKSLDGKRAKLSEAIEELQTMMERVRHREERLEQDRKLVQLYKDQWKFGPSIGGPSASSRDRLGSTRQRRNYESRLDPNLQRDILSVTGFQHIGSAMKLRQYSSANKGKPQQVRPKVNSQLRSKSLESVRCPPKRLAAPKNAPQKAASNFQNGKSSSEMNLASPPSDDFIEEKIEDEIKESPNDTSPDGDEQEPTTKEADKESEKVQKLTWIPVFGETEVKTVKRAAKRKVQAIKTSEDTGAALSEVQVTRVQQVSPSGPQTNTNQRQSCIRGNHSNRTMTEANKKLKFASDLLERERSDSSNRNQVLIGKTAPVPTPRRRTVASKSADNNEDATTTYAKSLVTNASLEIAKLEEKIDEQQKLLAKLLQTQERQSGSPVACPGGCRRSCASSRGQPANGTTSNKSLISMLRDRLNKTKLRLARTLEEERAKHQQLKHKMDSSLRKQSDLARENELLKQSLGKCIDTCLRDISNTFETLSETLSDTIVVNSNSSSEDVRAIPVTEAARLIADSRHLKQMRSHLETIERQRKGIFEELRSEKQRTTELELQLRQNQAELEQLVAAKRRLEGQLAEKSAERRTGSQLAASEAPAAAGQANESISSNTTSSNLDDTLNSVDLYRKYIQTMSPDIESLRRERESIFSEFDSIKRMIADINQS